MRGKEMYNIGEGIKGSGTKMHVMVDKQAAMACG